MTLTITIPDDLRDRLQRQAADQHVAPDQLALRLIHDALAEREDLPSLEEVVARIKATPPDPTKIERGKHAGDKEYIKYLLENPTPGTVTVEEWAELWPTIEAEMKEIDRADEIADGLL